jgi:hypothetical protein
MSSTVPLPISVALDDAPLSRFAVVAEAEDSVRGAPEVSA